MLKRDDRWIWGLLSVAVSLLPLIFIQKSGSLSLEFPLFLVQGDMDLVLNWIRGLTRGEFVPFLKNLLPRMGAPFGPIDFSAGFPLTEQLQLAVMKLYSLFTTNPTVIWNLHFLSGYILSSLGFFLAAISLGVVPPIAFGLSLAFTYLPYHYLRYEHLLISQYWVLAPATAICMRIWKEDNLLSRGKISALAAAVFFVTLWHSYFGFFFAGVFCLTWIARGIAKDRKRFFGVIGAVLLSFSLAIGLSVAHHFVARRQAAELPPSFSRAKSDSILFSLRPWAVFNPVEGHRSETLASIRERTMTGRGRIEGVTESIGTLGLIGFVLGMIQVFLFLTRKDRPKNLALSAGVLQILVFTFASRIGVAVVVAFTVSPVFRSTNRISPMLAAASLFGLGIALSHALERIRSGYRRVAAGAILGIAVAAFAVWDQVLVAEDVEMQSIGRWTTELFVKRIEAEVGEGAVLQLPFANFPEGGPIFRMYDYAHSEGPLFSTKTRWSYGTWRATRPTQEIALLSVGKVDLERVRKLGYAGIWVDRFGYPDLGEEILTELSTSVGRPTFLSNDGRRVFFRL